MTKQLSDDAQTEDIEAASKPYNPNLCAYMIEYARSGKENFKDFKESFAPKSDFLGLTYNIVHDQTTLLSHQLKDYQNQLKEDIGKQTDLQDNFNESTKLKLQLKKQKEALDAENQILEQKFNANIQNEKQELEQRTDALQKEIGKKQVLMDGLGDERLRLEQDIKILTPQLKH